jgi:tRNA nucleotidyltransferase (CCA-adding enzyme)
LAQKKCFFKSQRPAEAVAEALAHEAVDDRVHGAGNEDTRFKSRFLRALGLLGSEPGIFGFYFIFTSLFRCKRAYPF